jgi:hypothetical protein
MKSARSTGECCAMAIVIAGITVVWAGIAWTTVLQLIAR